MLSLLLQRSARLSCMVCCCVKELNQKRIFSSSSSFHNLTLSEVFGEVWSAPLTTIRADDVRGTVEKEISEKEYALKKAKCTKRNATPGDSTAPAASNPDVIEIDDDAWSIPSEDDCPKPPKVARRLSKIHRSVMLRLQQGRHFGRKNFRGRKKLGKQQMHPNAPQCLCFDDSLAGQVRQTTSRGWGRAEAKPQGRIGQAAEVQDPCLVSISFVSAVCPLRPCFMHFGRSLFGK